MRREKEFTAEKAKISLEKKGINVDLVQAQTICEFIKNDCRYRRKSMP